MARSRETFVHVEVCDLTGRLVQLDMERSTCVADLKDKLSQSFGIDSEAQALLVNSTVVRDADMLSKFESDSLSFFLVNNTHVLVARNNLEMAFRLRHMGFSSDGMYEALDALLQVVPLGMANDSVIQLLSSCIRQTCHERELHLALVRGLVQTAPSGHFGAALTVARCMYSCDLLDAYLQIDRSECNFSIECETFAPDAFKVKLKLYTCSSYCLDGHGVLKVLLKHSSANNECATAILRSILGCPRTSVRIQAIRIVSELASKGDRASIVEVCKRLKDQTQTVFDAACVALARLAPPGELEPEMAVVTLLSDDCGATRALGLRSLLLLPSISEIALAAVGTLSEVDESLECRLQALHVLGRHSMPGNQRSIEFVCKRLEDPCIKVRQAVPQVLSTLVPHESSLAQALILERLMHGGTAVRLAACAAFRVVSRVDETVGMACMLAHLDEDAKQMAMAQLQSQLSAKQERWLAKQKKARSRRGVQNSKVNIRHGEAEGYTTSEQTSLPEHTNGDARSPLMNVPDVRESNSTCQPQHRMEGNNCEIETQARIADESCGNADSDSASTSDSEFQGGSCLQEAANSEEVQRGNGLAIDETCDLLPSSTGHVCGMGGELRYAGGMRCTRINHGQRKVRWSVEGANVPRKNPRNLRYAKCDDRGRAVCREIVIHSSNSWYQSSLDVVLTVLGESRFLGSFPRED